MLLSCLKVCLSSEKSEVGDESLQFCRRERVTILLLAVVKTLLVLVVFLRGEISHVIGCGVSSHFEGEGCCAIIISASYFVHRLRNSLKLN